MRRMIQRLRILTSQAGLARSGPGGGSAPGPVVLNRAEARAYQRIVTPPATWKVSMSNSVLLPPGVRAEHRVAALDERPEFRGDHERDAGPRVHADLELPIGALLAEPRDVHLHAGEEETRPRTEIGLEAPLRELRALQEWQAEHHERRQGDDLQTRLRRGPLGGRGKVGDVCRHAEPSEALQPVAEAPPAHGLRVELDRVVDGRAVANRDIGVGGNRGAAVGVQEPLRGRRTGRDDDRTEADHHHHQVP